MKNEYGAKLDANGYAQSIVQDEADEMLFFLFFKRLLRSA